MRREWPFHGTNFDMKIKKLLTLRQAVRIMPSAQKLIQRPNIKKTKKKNKLKKPSKCIQFNFIYPIYKKTLT